MQWKNKMDNYDTRVGYMTIDIICKEFLEPMLSNIWQRDNDPLYVHYANFYIQYQEYLGGSRMEQEKGEYDG